MPQLSRALPFAAALLLGVAGPALAQGTDAQREACTPDAVRLCQDTIPDVGATEACMRRHEGELSRRCRAVFNDATGPATEPRRARRDDGDVEPRRSARVAPRPDEDDGYGPPSYQYLTPDGAAADTGDRYDRRADRTDRRARPIDPDEDFDDPHDGGGRPPYDER